MISRSFFSFGFFLIATLIGQKCNAMTSPCPEEFVCHSKMTLSGHEDLVMDAVFSDEGRSVATTSKDHTIRIWDVQSGRLKHTFKNSSAEILSSSFGYNNHYVASASKNGQVCVWDIQAGTSKCTLKYPVAISSLSLNPQHEFLVTSDDQVTCLYDIQSQQDEVLQNSFPVSLVPTFSPDGKLLAITADEKTVTILDVATRKTVSICSIIKGIVLSVAFHPQAQQFVTASTGDVVQQWDISSGKLISCICNGHAVNSVKISSDGRRVINRSIGNIVQIWDYATKNYKGTFVGNDGDIKAVAGSAEGVSVLTAGADNNAHIWDVEITN